MNQERDLEHVSSLGFAYHATVLLRVWPFSSLLYTIIGKMYDAARDASLIATPAGQPTC